MINWSVIMSGSAQETACVWCVVYMGTAMQRTPAGILLLDSATDCLYAKLTPDPQTTDEDSNLWWSEFRDQMQADSGNAGGTALFQFLQESASLSVTVSDAQNLLCGDIKRCLETLYLIHVNRRL
jgi:hypothetical protein